MKIKENEFTFYVLINIFRMYKVKKVKCEQCT